MYEKLERTRSEETCPEMGGAEAPAGLLIVVKQPGHPAKPEEYVSYMRQILMAQVYLALDKGAYTAFVVVANGLDVFDLWIDREVNGEHVVEIWDINVGRQASTWRT